MTGPTADKIEAAIAFDQPKLRVQKHGAHIHVQGYYLVTDPSATAQVGGPITEYEIAIRLSRKYPMQEPAVYEIGGRIPRKPSRHINPNGDCCITVWEHWLLTAADNSFANYLGGPVNEYFLGQYRYEQTGKWPFGERAHGQAGLLEAYAQILGVSPRHRTVAYYLRLLSQDWPKGHWRCPCGSGKRLRDCHRNDLAQLHYQIPPAYAQSMVRRLNSQNEG